MTLSSAERRTVLQAISIAIEKERSVIREHQRQAPPNGLRESTQERQRELRKFEELRARIIEADDRRRTAVPIKLI
jgi:hypothetical protein